MPVFEYKGLTKAGKNVRGTLDSDNVRTAKLKLKKEGVFVVDIKDKTRAAQKKSKGKKGAAHKAVKVEELSMMTRQLSTLMKANIPLVEALAALAEQIENPMLSDVVAEIKNSVNEGGSFHKGLQRYPKIFDKIYVSMCEAGEASGTLHTILMRLTEFTESQSALVAKVRSAMMYPVLMLIFTFGLLGALFIFVIPKITAVFEASPELTLPWYTVVVIDFSAILVNYWYILIGAAILVVLLFKSWKKTPAGRYQYDAMILKAPVIGKLARIVAVSRFTRTLATLLDGGVPMLNAMGIVRNVVNNEILAEALDAARENISEGESIAGPLKKSGQFPPLVIHMINIGEKTGDLENMLNQVSESYDFQVKVAVDGLTSMLEPLMIILMGCVIAIIVFSIMIPMFELSNLGG